MAYLCIYPACGEKCSGCNHAISPEEIVQYAIRYATVRNTDGFYWIHRGNHDEFDQMVDEDIARLKSRINPCKI